MSDDVPTKKKRAAGAGRPAYPDDKVFKNVSIRLNNSQKDILKVLGGSEWIRKKLNDELEKLDT